jgi:hypothetical protein
MGLDYCETNSGYLAAGVVIHMDDSELNVQVRQCELAFQITWMTWNECAGVVQACTVVCVVDAALVLRSCSHIED